MAAIMTVCNEDAAAHCFVTIDFSASARIFPEAVSSVSESL